ncbi:hypothetical protein QTP88_006017 [Uroleucon formosanum]
MAYYYIPNFFTFENSIYSWLMYKLPLARDLTTVLQMVEIKVSNSSILHADILQSYFHVDDLVFKISPMCAKTLKILSKVIPNAMGEPMITMVSNLYYLIFSLIPKSKLITNLIGRRHTMMSYEIY